MPNRRSRRPSAALSAKTAELALAVPQVVAHRVARMALAGPQPSPRDRREFSRMVSEKATAFQQSWWAMALHATRAWQAMATQLWLAALGVWGQGLAPVHRKAVGNARRLSRTRLR